MSNGHTSKGAEGAVYLVSQCACKRILGEPMTIVAHDVGSSKGASNGWVKVMIDQITLCRTRQTVPRHAEQGQPALGLDHEWRA